MNDLFLNFLNTSTKIEEIKRYKRISGSSFILIFVFSLYIVGHIFFTQYFMVDAYRSRLSNIHKKINAIEPRVKFLEAKLGERTGLNNSLGDFTLIEKRPKVWVPRLLEISNLLPGDVLLTKISYQQPKFIKNDPALIIHGEHILKKGEQDYNFLDEIINNWNSSRSLPRYFKSIKILENNIIKEKDDIKITFSIGFFLT